MPALLANCEGCKDDPKPISELEKLPTATQKGMNTLDVYSTGKLGLLKFQRMLRLPTRKVSLPLEQKLMNRA